MMRDTKWALCAGLAVMLLASAPVFAQGNGRGRGHNKGDQNDSQDYDHGDRDHHGDDQDVRYYRDSDRREMHDWYVQQQGHLPPGLAKKDRLPPGLEKQLVVRGTLPPGLQKKIEPAPAVLVRELPPPPPDCEHVIIGGHLVLLNQKNFTIMDVFHFEF